MTAHGIDLSTLKDCLQFLKWLNDSQQSSMRGKVAEELARRVSDKYNSVNTREIQNALSQFLGHVTKFHRKLCHNPAAGIYRGKNANDITEALLECIPKFLTALYYLWYDVNATFGTLGGGGWKLDYPGYEREWRMWSSSGGDLQKYFRATVSDAENYGGIIPGGFGFQEIRHNDDWYGYYQGYLMEGDIKNILDKQKNQFFRDIFATSVVSKSGLHKVNTANALALVGTFCEIVADAEKKKQVDQLKNVVKPPDKCINWGHLKDHCAQLQRQFSKIFKRQRFSHTGESPKLKDLNTRKFAQSAADWLRTNLETVRTNLSNISTSGPNIQRYRDNLGEYFTKHFFPYGFTFDNHYGISSNVAKNLPKELNGVIVEFVKRKNGLEKLREILEGENCPDQPKSSSETVSPNAKGSGTSVTTGGGGGQKGGTQGNATPGSTSSVTSKGAANKTEATTPKAAEPTAPKSEAVKPPATTTTATPPQGKKADGTPDQGTAGNGPQNTGSRNQGASNQNNGQSAAHPATSSVVKSPTSPSPGGAGASGTPGAKGDKGKQGSPDSKPTSVVQTGQNNVQKQQPLPPPQPALTPQATPPRAPAVPGPNGSPSGGGGAGPKAGDTSSSAKSQPSSVQLPGPQSSSASGNSGVKGSASVPGPTGAKGQDTQGGSNAGTQPAGASQSVTTQRSSDSSPVPPSSGGPGIGGGQVSTAVPGQQGDNGLGARGGVTDSSRPAISTSAGQLSTPGASTSGPQPSGASGSSGGQGPGGQGPASDPAQSRDQVVQTSQISNGTSSGDSGADSGGGGDRAGGGGKQKPVAAITKSIQCSANQIESVDMSGKPFCRNKPNTSYRKPLSENAVNKITNAYEKTVVENILNELNTKHPNRRILQSRIPPTPPSQPSRPAPGPYPLPPGGRDVQGRRYYEPAEGRGRHDDGSMAVNQPSEFDGQPIPDTASKELQERIKNKVEGIKFLKSLESKAQQEEVEQLRRDEKTVNAEQEKKAKAEWEKRKQQGKGVKKHDEDLDRIQKTLQRSNRANEARLRQEEEQRKFIEAAPQLDGSQATDDAYGERWPWWYPGLLYREVTGKPIDDDLPEQLQDQRERLFHEKIQDDLGRHIDERKELKTLERQEKDRIEQHNKDAEEKLRQGRIQHMQLNPPITTVLPPLPDPRELPDSLKHPDITFKVVDDTDGQSFAQKSQDAAQRIKDYYEEQKQRVEDEKKVYKEELEQKMKNATQAHVESIKRAGEIVQSEMLQKKFHGGDFDIALAPSLKVDDFEENAHEAYRIYGPSPKKTPDKIFEYNPKWNNVINYGLIVDPNPNMCNNPWNYAHDSATSSTLPPPPDSDHLPPPTNVKAMLFWLVGLNTYGLIAKMERHMENILNEINGDTFYPKYALQVNGDLSSLSASHIADTLTEACLYSAHVLNGIMRMQSGDALSDIDFKLEYDKLHYSPDPACLLCQLRDYVYACCHQLQFLKSQCSRDKLSGGWQDCGYGSDITASKSPLQAFLTDGWDSDFDTHPFDPCNLCHKSRVRMGFQANDLPKSSQQGSAISSILTPSCGGDDPLLTLCSYLNCLTRRTPRTTGELVSFFHHFGIELHDFDQSKLSKLGTSLCNPHPDCPDWDRLKNSSLHAVKGIRGTEALISKHNSNHNNEHPRTLSTLVGCSSATANCPQHCSPITYRAYALYSQSFAHTYLSWAAYLPDRLWESLDKLHYDLQKHLGSGKCSSLHSCPYAMPLLYLHGFTPPGVGSQPKLTCSDVTAKLQEIVNGGPIATLMTAMDNFLYNIREPFIFTLLTLWSTALLVLANTMLYRLDVLHIRSHLIRTKASHHIDVKALLTKGRKMLSLYKDVDYFDEDPIGQLAL
ncbi:hypothetical protein BBBOND_0308170 [Babesia bigemina]|uniref:Ribosome-binding protein 1 n=1 Tax=Babesia bigemina TaxID=5866 RepID=A0A061BK77_BABBI|nr:hypothetical protein BBBOND_0308170 [Babesia bigemina]XP_012770827.1 hypothetical protein, conserved [Babesia bigemina]CDR71885.1 hypothetical protein, conserved [Babesia bigemina]CDR96913.1 hypothetical protein BBBOND_0308170 [Babesia bigemina]|eukprot:XP_012769099.1 hypothetical protein BBBOND_0308170 [Babesia bigemina]